jgi:hypothetical protein
VVNRGLVFEVIGTPEDDGHARFARKNHVFKIPKVLLLHIPIYLDIM